VWNTGVNTVLQTRQRTETHAEVCHRTGKEKIIAGLAKKNHQRVISNHSDSDLSHNF
jgi:hypothetical protein